MTNTTSSDINLELPALTTENVSAAAQGLLANFIEKIGDVAFWAPMIAIIVAMVIGAFARRLLRPRLMTWIDSKNMSFRMNILFKNMTKLLLPLVALIVIALSESVWQVIDATADITLLTVAIKLLTAWILIRALAQVIENSFTRQIVALCGWIIAALSILGVMDQAMAAMDAVGMDFGDFRLSLLTIIKFVMAIGILLAMTKFLTNAAERSLHSVTDLTPSARVLLIKTIKVILVTLAILIGVTASGIDLSALAIFGGALGLGIGFGLQKVISNLFSGMLLLVDKSIKPGDIIEMRDGSGVFGWVSQLNARYVSIVTRDNKEYLIPNEDFITQPVINWSFTDKKIRVETQFGVSYDSDPHLIKKLGVEVALKVNRVVPDPKPVCHLVEFGDSSLNFVLRYWIEDAQNGVTNTKGDVMLGLWDAFKENGIVIPFPHRVLVDKREK